jgi:tetratricopeptide (TPR) repeat protein
MLVLRALRAPTLTCALVGAGFALHPVNVASVAWLAERKNLLAGALFWLSLLLYLQHRREGRAWRYGLSLLVFALALLAKVSALTLAPLLLLTDRLLDGRWSSGALRRAAPFAVLGVLAALQTASREAFIANTWDPVAWHLRPLIASSALVHYVSKAALPYELALIYPRWPESLAVPGYWLSAATVATAALLAHRHRRRVGGLWIWALALFLLNVAPVLGLKHFVWMDFAFASDHYMYQGLAGLLLAGTLPLERWCRAPATAPSAATFAGYAKPRLALLVAVSGLLLGVYAARARQHCATWRNDWTLWEHTLRVSPECLIAHLNLANEQARGGELERAHEHYRRATEIQPALVKGWRLTAQTAASLGRADEAVAYYERGVAVQEAKSPTAWSMRYRLAEYLDRLGRRDAARRHYEVVLGKRPGPNATRHVEQRLRELRR